jgi:hypothetical protein
MKNLFIDGKVLNQLKSELKSFFKPDVVQYLTYLRDKFGYVFLNDVQTNRRLLWEFSARQLAGANNKLSKEFHEVHGDAFRKQELIQNWIDDYYQTEAEWLSKFYTVELFRVLNDFEREYEIRLPMIELCFGDIDTILSKYETQQINKNVLKQTQEFQKTIDRLFFKKSPEEIEVITRAITLYNETKNFMLLHNFLVRSNIDYQV